MSEIAIVGAGMMGSALCWPLSDNRQSIRLVGTFLDEDIIESCQTTGIHPKLQRHLPQRVVPYSYTQMNEALTGVDFIVSGVSSFGVDWFARTTGPFLQPEIPVIAVTKGLEDQPDGDLHILPVATNNRLPDEKKGKISLNAIGGPCISHELAARRQTAVVFCGQDYQVLEKLRGIFATDYYHIRLSTDVKGVEVCAALKNAYAMGVSLAMGMMDRSGADGLANMYNPQAALFGQSCLEMRRLLEITQGGVENVSWLPGAGDLFVTVFGGRTMRLGRLLGQGLSFKEARGQLAGETMESVEIITRVARALPKLAARGVTRLEYFPLLLHMDQIVNHGQVVNIPWNKFYLDA